MDRHSRLTTFERLRQWVDWWQSPGDPSESGPRRPRYITTYHDNQLKRAAQNIAAIERERGL